MKVIAGLGNPGDKYLYTRHNVGFMLLDTLAYYFNEKFKFESKFNAEIVKATYKDEQVMLVKPQTFMNLSGNAIREIISFYKLSNSDLFVVYDDISLNLSSIRYRPKGSDGGHNGIKSIIYSLGTSDFDRLKIGIGPQPSFMSSEAFVLQNFQKEELDTLKETLKFSLDSVLYYLDFGIQQTQNKFNKK